MAFATKYEYTYYDARGVKTWVDIQDESGETKADIERMGDEPFVIEYEGKGNDVLEVIKGSSCKLTLMTSETQTWEEFWSASPKEYKIIISKYIDGSWYGIWTGWILPENISEEDVGHPHSFILTATDGLGDLKNYACDDDGTRYTGNTKLSSIIYYCLNKIGLGLNVVSAVNIYDTSMDNDPTTDDPLIQCNVNAEALLDENYVPRNCYDVLNEILKCYNARIFIGNIPGLSTNPTWNIIPIAENAQTFYCRELSDAATIAGYSTYNPQKTITTTWADRTSMLKFINNSKVKSKLSRYKKVRYVQDYGYKDRRLIPYSNFPSFIFSGGISDADIAHWSKGDSATLYYTIKDDYFSYLGIKYVAGDADYVYSPNVSYYDPMAAAGDGKLSFEVKFRMNGTPNATATFKMKIKLWDGSNWWYLKEGTGWTVLDSAITYSGISVESGWVVKNICVDELVSPPDYFVIMLYQPTSISGTVTSVDIEHFDMWLEPGLAYTFPRTTGTTASYDAKGTATKEITFKFGDAPSSVNELLVYQNLFYTVSPQTLTSSWRWHGSTESGHLKTLIENYLGHLYGNDRLQIEGEIFGSYSFADVLVDPNNDNKRFLCTGGSYHDRTCTWEAHWAEIFGHDYDEVLTLAEASASSSFDNIIVKTSSIQPDIRAKKDGEDYNNTGELNYTAGNYSFDIDVSPDIIQWAVSDDAAWVTCSDSGTGDKNGVAFSVTENDTGSPRSATITITESGTSYGAADWTITVHQIANPI